MNGIGLARGIAPAEVGNDFYDPPMLACYLQSSPPSSYWIMVSDGYSASNAYCVLAIDEDGHWSLEMQNADPGREALFVIHY